MKNAMLAFRRSSDHRPDPMVVIDRLAELQSELILDLSETDDPIVRANIEDSIDRIGNELSILFDSLNA